MTTNVTMQEMYRTAAAHANLARRSAELGWRHLQSEYSQDIPQVLATIETGGPWTWTLPNALPTAEGNLGIAKSSGDDELHFISATSMEEIEDQYHSMRETVELWDWLSITELRGVWYMVTYGVGYVQDVQSRERFSLESVTLFPVGEDGILGEVQIGTLANDRVNRWPEVPAEPGDIPLPLRRVHATTLHNDYLEALRKEDVDGVLATFRPNFVAAIRDYTTDDYTVLNAGSPDVMRDYYERLFARYRIVEVQLVNRVIESWWTFAELHWTVERRDGDRAGELLEFCTADIAPIGADGKFWVATGAGTDPVPSERTDAGTKPVAHERGPLAGWELPLVAESEARSREA